MYVSIVCRRRHTLSLESSIYYHLLYLFFSLTFVCSSPLYSLPMPLLPPSSCGDACLVGSRNFRSPNCPYLGLYSTYGGDSLLVGHVLTYRRCVLCKNCDRLCHWSVKWQWSHLLGPLYIYQCSHWFYHVFVQRFLSILLRQPLWISLVDSIPPRIYVRNDPLITLQAFLYKEFFGVDLGKSQHSNSKALW